METSAVTTQVNNTVAVQQTPAIQKDAVSEANSFQNTLNGLNNEVQTVSQTNSEQVSSKIESTVETNVSKNSENSLIQENQTLQIKQDIKNQKNLQTAQNLLQQQIADENLLGLQIVSEQNQVAQDKSLQQNVAEKEVFNLNQESQNINSLIKPENLLFNLDELSDEVNSNGNSLRKDVVILPQLINKNANEKLPLEGKIVKSKEVRDNLLAKEEIFLEESLDFVSKKHIENPELNNEIINNAIEKDIAERQSIVSNITPLKDSKLALETFSDLNSKISAINSITTKSTSKNMLGSIKVSLEDASFFAKAVENSSNNNFQTNIALNIANNQVNMTEAKTQSLQSSAAVSQALIEKLQESMNTNKAFRVDFDKDVAVIMRVDSNGVLSANFVPGSSAVEQALRNNLAELRQSLDNKGIEYNELSYTSRQQQKQKQQQRNQKGGRDE